MTFSGLHKGHRNYILQNEQASIFLGGRVEDASPRVVHANTSEDTKPVSFAFSDAPTGHQCFICSTFLFDRAERQSSAVGFKGWGKSRRVKDAKKLHQRVQIKEKRVNTKTRLAQTTQAVL